MKNLGVATRLFINGKQIGSDGTHMDYYPSTDDAVADTQLFYEAEATRLRTSNSICYLVGPAPSPFRP